MDFAEFKREVHRRFGLYLDGYKEPQLKRRIDSLMSLLQVPDYAAYLRLLSQDSQQWQRFIDKITINVSEFFRNPEIFARLEKEILPPLLARHQSLKVWSAACADGPEPYSVAILLNELAPAGRHQIDATDIDTSALAAARRGVYPSRAIQAVTPERRERYFRREGDNFYLQEKIKHMVNFRRHDLLKDPFGSGYHLILCRNVVIYFTAATQNELYRRFYQALAPGGVLFIGATESLFQYRELGFIKVAPWFYRRPEV
ncbi:Chemotaxis protein methyltransferase [Neomoorella glycerini]|uniref:protein-glutamate O-methyltransferase n=1 Tax=Neomoorella glycerini TaxID=55779 RepID=A0A6I5ZTK1_9FIRM|nr:protein-glutamate O-methyltransferase CheR [Moorella glycerini]QGP92867.1 Chemotaxis protein methyltransferase [Moorella glycerini]